MEKTGSESEKAPIYVIKSQISILLPNNHGGMEVRGRTRRASLVCF